MVVQGKENVQNNKMRNKLENWIKQIIKYLYPVIFFESVFANMFSYYVTFGNRIERVRMIISWGIIVGIFFLAVSYLMLCLKEKRKYILLLVVPMFLLGSLVLTLFKEGYDANLLRQIVLTVLYCVPAFAFALYAVVEKLGRRLFDSFWYCSIFMLPGYVIFILFALFGWNKGGNWNSIGGIGYLSMGYSALFLFAGMIINLLFGIRQFSTKLYVLYGVSMTVTIFVCVIGGSKGALLGVIGCIVLVFLAMLLKKYPIKKMYLIPVGACLMVVFALVLGSGASLGAQRLDALKDRFSDGTLLAVLDSEKADESTEMNECISSSKETVSTDESLEEQPETNEVPPQVDESLGEQHGTEAEQENGEDRNVDVKAEVNEKLQSTGSLARVYLYKLAWEEIKTNPIQGLGAFGYQKKYGTFPHNVLLEAGVDYGIITTGIIFLYLVGCVCYAIRKSEKWSYTGCVLFCCVLGIYMMLSAVLYHSVELMWVVTYFQAMAIDKMSAKKQPHYRQ